MYDTSAEGQMTVSGQVVGGHEYLLDELDVERQRVWMRNSWGDGLRDQRPRLDGMGGSAPAAGRRWRLHGARPARRARANARAGTAKPADAHACTHPRTHPAPTPVPPAPDVSAPLRTALTKFAKTTACPKYLKKAADVWLASFPSTSKRSSR
jgi:hypothetical protein